MRKVHLFSGIEYLQLNRIVPSNKITICLEKTFIYLLQFKVNGISDGHEIILMFQVLDIRKAKLQVDTYLMQTNGTRNFSIKARETLKL